MTAVAIATVSAKSYAKYWVKVGLKNQSVIQKNLNCVSNLKKNT